MRALQYLTIVGATLSLLTVIIFANLAVQHYWARVTTYALAAGLLALYALVQGLLPLLLDLSGFLRLVRVQSGPSLAALGIGQLLASTLAGLALLPRVRRWAARFLPFDPDHPVHMVALSMTLLLAAGQLANQFGSDVVADYANFGMELNALDLVAQELPFVVGALAGVGIFLRRPPAATLQRLGFVMPSWWQVVLALVVAGGFFALSNGVDYLNHVLTPGLASKVDKASERLLGQLVKEPAGILVLALAAGVCEETLFRGALQPRFGIVYVSILFAAIHSQYGLTLVALVPLLAGLGLGWLRRYTNTSTSTICHVVYDALVGVWGITTIRVGFAIAAEALLLLLLLAFFVRSRPGLRLPVRP